MSSYLLIAFALLMVAKYALVFSGRIRLAAYSAFGQAGVIGLIVITAHKQAVASGVASEPITMYVLLSLLAILNFFVGRSLLIRADKNSQAPKP